jgi:glycosyltransferase involved in cell wall biosynthesis
MGKEIKVLAWPAFNYEPFNPYNRLLNKNLERLGVCIIPFSPIKTLYKSYDIWHMHWPAENVIRDNFFTTIIRFLCFFMLAMVSKIKGAKLVWTAHNHKLHDPKHVIMEKAFWKLFPFFIDVTISHSKFAQNTLIEKKPILEKKRNHVIYHGHYRSWYKDDLSKKGARKTLGLSLNEFVFLFAGNIKPYKNVLKLVSLFKERERKREKLIIVGKPSSKVLLKEINKFVKADNDILFFPGWIKDDDFELYFNASDLAVLPYQILNSGMALLSLSFDCPVLMPSNPMLNEYQNIIGKDLICLYEKELNNNILSKTKKNIVDIDNPENNIEELDWSIIAQKTLEVYSKTI